MNGGKIMAKETGNLTVSVIITCINCYHVIDLFSIQELIDDGWLYNLLMPRDGPWSGACKDFSKEYRDSFGEDFKCPGCDKIIEIGEIYW